MHFNNINVDNTSSEGVTLAGKISPSYTTGNLTIRDGYSQSCISKLQWCAVD